MKKDIILRIEIVREGDLFVGICPDLQISSFGETIEEARRSVREAVEAFIEECESMGTLDEVLEEAGFTQEAGRWQPRQPVSAELVPIG
jgi:predicted RNase H-like HicB family nuclease